MPELTGFLSGKLSLAYCMKANMLNGQGLVASINNTIPHVPAPWGDSSG